jgi:BMFP domain-containing protein YqiC
MTEISLEARNAARRVKFDWPGSAFGLNEEQLAERFQQAINAAAAPMQKRIEELEKRQLPGNNEYYSIVEQEAIDAQKQRDTLIARVKELEKDNADLIRSVKLSGSNHASDSETWLHERDTLQQRVAELEGQLEHAAKQYQLGIEKLMELHAINSAIEKEKGDK